MPFAADALSFPGVNGFQCVQTAAALIASLNRGLPLFSNTPHIVWLWLSWQQYWRHVVSHLVSR